MLQLSQLGHDKDRLTVMLACLGDGTKLLRYVVFKRKTLTKKTTFPHGLVWSKVGLSCHKSVLVWDSFHMHLSKPIWTTFQSLNTECALIPGGRTGILQPLATVLTSPSKMALVKHDDIRSGTKVNSCHGRLQVVQESIG